MNVKRTMTLVAVCGVLAALLSSAATSGGRRPVTQPIRKPTAVDVSGAALAAEIARLHDRLHPTALPLQPGRNLFEFRAAPAARAFAAAPAVRQPELEPPAEPPRPVLRLIGIAEDAAPEGPIRTAILSGNGGLFFVGEGDTVAARFIVAHVSEDSIDLTDMNDGGALRLTLK